MDTFTKMRKNNDKIYTPDWKQTKLQCIISPISSILSCSAKTSSGCLDQFNLNTKFFHARASQRLRRNGIQIIVADGQTHVTHAAKVAALTAHFTKLLGEPDSISWGFDVGNLYCQRQHVQAQPLVAPFTASEAFQAVSSMNSNSAPGPDGLGLGFYKAAWHTVEQDVMHFLNDFHAGVTQLDSLNRAHIMLLPKKDAATSPADFRPISLQNCPVKILTKILTTRLQQQIQNLGY